MKNSSILPSFLKKAYFASGLVALGLCQTLNAATYTWDGGPSGTGTAFLTPENWTLDTVPGSGDAAQWNNTVTGDLALTFSGAVGGSNGLDLVLQPAQTGNVSLTATVGTTFRVNNITSTAGAGALNLGASGTGFTLALGSGSVTSHTWSNNSLNTVTVGPSAVIANGGAVAHSLVITGSGNWTIAGSIVNAIAGGQATSISKTGEGTLSLSGNNVNAGSNNAWTGNATVSAGTLLVTGNSSNATFSSSGGVLAGTGSLGVTNIQTGGSLGAGNNGLGTISTRTISFLGTGAFLLDINTSTVASDLVNVTGNLNIDNTAVLTLNDLGSDQVLTLGTTFTVIEYSGTWNGGTFAGFADDSVFDFGVNQFRISYNGLDDLSSTVVLTVVPEPGASVLFVAASCWLLFFRRRVIARRMNASWC